MEDKYYYKDGSVLDWLDFTRCLHREDGPAVEYTNGSKMWFINNNLHKEDGPAIIYVDGNKWWYINGKELTEEQFNHITEAYNERQATV